MMTKRQLMNVMPTILFVSGCVGVFTSVIFSARDTLKAEKIIRQDPMIIDKKVIYDEPDENGVEGEIVRKDLKELVPSVVKATWKCYIPTAISLTATLTCLIASNRLTYKQIAALSSAVAGAGALVSKYRDKIREFASEDVLHDIDAEVAKEEITKAKPPVVSTNGLLSCEEMDLSEDGEYIFFDPFTKIKFRSTKLAVMGAKYFINRNFALGSEVPLSMFYAFLGMELPEEYKNAGWDASAMADDGYYWIDIDIVRSNAPDPETLEMYYILEYDFLPGDMDDNYYPFGNPLSQEGSYAV